MLETIAEARRDSGYSLVFLLLSHEKAKVLPLPKLEHDVSQEIPPQMLNHGKALLGIRGDGQSRAEWSLSLTPDPYGDLMIPFLKVLKNFQGYCGKMDSIHIVLDGLQHPV